METGQYCQRWCFKIFFLFLTISILNPVLGEKNLLAISNWGVTQTKIIKLNYLWTIDNFSLHNEEVGENFESPIFSSPKNNTFKWNLRMYPNGKDSGYKDDIAIFLIYQEGPLPSLEVSWEISVLNTSRGKQKTVTDKDRFERGYGWGRIEFIEKAYVLDKKNALIANDSIYIFTEFTFYVATKKISGDCNIRGESDVEDQFSDHLEPLLESGDYSDAVLMVRSQQFPVHKNILAARSSVFSALFVNGVKDPVVQAIDVDPDVMKEALRYIYTGRVRNLESISKELLRVASVYKIDGLQALCEESLCKSLSVDNAVDILGLAGRCKADKLTSKAVKFIAAHAAKLINTDKFKAFQNSHPDVIVEVFNVMMKNELE